MNTTTNLKLDDNGLLRWIPVLLCIVESLIDSDSSISSNNALCSLRGNLPCWDCLRLVGIVPSGIQPSQVGAGRSEAP